MSEVDEKVIAISVAFCDQSKGFCYKGGLPWPYIKKDHEVYMSRASTTVHPEKKNGIVKGRHCWETMREADKKNPKQSIVVTSTTMKETPPACRAVVRSYDEAVVELLDGVQKGELENIWIFGGLKNYQHAIEDPRVTHLYITRIFHEFPVDGSFPEFEHSFELASTSEIFTDNSITLQFETWHRKKTD